MVSSLGFVEVGRARVEEWSIFLVFATKPQFFLFGKAPELTDIPSRQSIYLLKDVILILSSILRRPRIRAFKTGAFARS